MINYPNKKRRQDRKIVSTANRGMNFENMINQTNEFYLNNDLAIIHKKPIPIQIVKVDYKQRSAAKIVEAYYKLPSTTDYNGIYKGRYIDFEAKETKNKTSFPIKNIHEHQVIHLEQCAKHGAIAFIIIYFSLLDRIFFLDQKYVSEYYHRAKNSRKSITLAEIEKYGIEITEGYRKPVDYLKVIDEHYL
ncbi:MAG: Holliday junction resolvase RecU [Candidatus Izemoplasmatales bacterium]|uniref:Holliday junction resolvase RecU n=1 Tax=Hujiaoplasma nucleasis TaxID=2725268 RepID=A0A7L6N6S3_9MOLU|nr:Holliday junction resolvase RecU [Hujiaoplasma nucleasis]QLY40947.1 Holliday junction resolvase RecU [Hujiaoplasma nucleasis]